ncbi:MAG TPA: glycosyltransferase [bacterium]
MRLLIFLPSLAIGGAQRTTLTLANGLDRRRWQVLLALGTGGPFAAELSADVRKIPLRARRVRHAVLPLASILRRAKPAVAFAPMPDADLALTAAWRLAGRPCALVLRESNHRSAEGRLKRGPFDRLLGWAYRQADRVVALSRGVEADIRARYGVPPERVRTIYNPIDLKRIASLRHAAQPALRGREGLRIVAVARLIRQKGIDILLHACRSLPDLPVRLTVLGDGPERRALEGMAAEFGLLDRVTFLGWSENPYPWMAQADMLVVPSRWEGFGHVIVEGMACGTPVIAARCPAGPDEIITHGEDGLLCEPESPAALADSIRALAGDPELRRRLSSRATETAKRFDVGAVAGEYDALFTELALGGRVPPPSRRRIEMAPVPC